MSKSKDASSKLHEKHQTILADILRDEDNRYCADCTAKGPRWASWNLGVFMCIRCAGIHRNLGVHISKVKSVNLDAWTPQQIESIQKGGNGRAKSTYEANLPANFRRPQDDYAVEQFIRAKYERKQYICRAGSSEPSKQTTAPAKESQEQKAKSKAKKTPNTHKLSSEQISVPRPAGRSPSPHPPKPTPSSSSTKNKGSNLISLDTGPSSAPSSRPSSKKSSPQPSVDLLTGLTSSSSDHSSLSGSSSSSSNSHPNPAPSVQPVFGAQPQPPLLHDSAAAAGGTNAKDSIMSLYAAQNKPQLSSYTAQGYPVNSFYYRQQQEAAMRMAHVAALQQHQVNQVTAQMQHIKKTQPPHPVPSAGPHGYPGMNNGEVPGIGVQGAGGQTLNPTLW